MVNDYVYKIYVARRVYTGHQEAIVVWKLIILTFFGNSLFGNLRARVHTHTERERETYVSTN